MAGDMTLAIRINADGSAAVTGIRRVEDSTKQLGKQAKETGQLLGAMSDELKGLAAGAGVTGLAMAIRQIGLTGDSLRSMGTSIKQLSGNAGGFQDLYQYAQKLGIGLTDARDQLNQFVPALSKVGLGFKDSIQFATDLTSAMRVYGVQGQAAAAVTLQLGQALSGGVLNGDELTVIAQNAGGLGVQLEKIIQRILGTNESLKKLGEQGQLTSAVVAAAFQELFADLRPKFAEIPQMLEQQESRFANAAQRMFAAVDQKLKLSEMWQFYTSLGAAGLEVLGDRLSGSLAPASMRLTKDPATGAPLVSTARSEQDRFNELVGQRMDLKGQLGQQNQRLQDLLPGEGIKPGASRDLAVVRAEIKDTTAQLTQVETEIRRIQDAAKAGVTSGAKDASQAAKDSAAAAWQKVREQYDKSDKAARDFADGAKVVNNQLAAGDITREKAIEQLRWLKTVTLDAAEGTGKLTKAQQAQEATLEEYASRVAAVLKLGAAQKQTLIDILPVVDEMAQRYGVAREAILSVINAESRFRPNADSGKAKGLMQITPPTAKDLGGRLGIDPQAILTDPKANIEAGTSYLARLMEQFGSLPKALWAYNAGPARAQSGTLPDETKAYIDESDQKSPLWALNKLIPLAEQGGRAFRDELAQGVEESRKALAAGVQAIYQADDAYTAALKPVDDFVRSLTDQRQSLSQTAEEQARANAALVINNQLLEINTRQAEAARAAALDAVQTGKRVDMTQVDAYTRARDTITQRRAGIIDQAGSTAREQDASKARIADMQNSTDRVADAARDMGRAFGDAFGQMAQGGVTARSVMESLVQQIEQIVIQLLIVQPIAEAVGNALKSAFGVSGASPASGAAQAAGSMAMSGIGSWLGGLFGFAQGGVVLSGVGQGIITAPTLFPLAIPGHHRYAQGTGLMGEAGPEAILPLTRIGGDLGVKAQLAQPAVNVTVNNLPGQDARTQSDGQGGITIDIIRAVIADDFRRGGTDVARAAEGAYPGLRRGR
jgi:tape measure domain-containing protein